MFCPKCSQHQPAEDLRFCPRCGFPLHHVLELISQEEARGVDGAARTVRDEALPAQKYLTTGALLMFAGCVVAVLWGFMGTRSPAEVVLPQSYFIMGGALAFLLIFLHPLLRWLEGLTSGRAAPDSRRRRNGINLGALLMFLGGLKAMLLTSLMPPGPERGFTTLAVMAGMLILVLLLRPILMVARGLFFGMQSAADSSEADTPARLGGESRSPALPPAQSVPVNGFTPARAVTAEPAAPPSVTEETTRKLNT